MKALLLVLVLLVGFASPDAHAAGPIARDFPPGLQIPDAARPGSHFDVDRATESYLTLLSPEQRRLSDAYFEGGYWLLLWSFLYGTAVGALLLLSGLSVGMRNTARRIARWRWLSTALYAVFWHATRACGSTNRRPSSAK